MSREPVVTAALCTNCREFAQPVLDRDVYRCPCCFRETAAIEIVAATHVQQESN